MSALSAAKADRVRRSFYSDGCFCKNTLSNVSLLSNCNEGSVRLVHLSTRKAIVDYTSIKVQSGHSLGYEFYSATSLAKVGRDGRKVFYMRKKSRQFDQLFFSYFIVFTFLLITMINNSEC